MTLHVRTPATMRRSCLSLWLLALGALAGCRGSDSGQGSRGADGTATWRLDAPSTRVGSGGPGHELDRVYGGILRPDGTLVLGNSGTQELRYFSRGGQLGRTAGRSGAGPGEFGSINWIAALPGDSLLAFDMRHQRFSVWDSAGVFARTFTTSPPVPGPVRPVGVLRDGSILVAVEGQYDPRAGAGVVRDSLRLVRIGPRGGVLRQMGSYAGAEWLVYEHPTSFRATQLPYGRMGHLAQVGDHVVYGSSESGRLAVLDGSGKPVRTIDLPSSGRTVSREEISSLISEIQDEPERSALARHYRGSRNPSAPVFTALRGGGDGNLWVRLSPSAAADSVMWMVLSPEGRPVGSVRMHVSTLLLDSRGDTVLVRESDADGVQRVSVRRVLR